MIFEQTYELFIKYHYDCCYMIASSLTFGKEILPLSLDRPTKSLHT